MNRISISNKVFFRPKENEIFFAEVPNIGLDVRVKTLVSKDGNACENCVFHSGELSVLCGGVICVENKKRYTFRRIRNGKV